MKKVGKLVAALGVIAAVFGMIGCAPDSYDGTKSVAKPTFSVATGAVVSGTEVTISCATVGATIYYTTDGTEPTVESTEYSVAISVTSVKKLKAFAVKDGMSNSAVTSAVFYVVPTTSNCVPGDFVLKDGTMLPMDLDLTDIQKSNVAAVIVRAKNGATPALGVGIVHNQTGLAWCTSSAVGCNKNITALQGEEESGYMDGSDSWSLLNTALSNDAANNPDNYPAWKFCKDYAIGKGFSEDLATGWYLPTIAELKTIYEKKNVINESLGKVGDNQFIKQYWSCCQSSSHEILAKNLDFGYGNISDVGKNWVAPYVCSVRAFN